MEALDLATNLLSVLEASCGEAAAAAASERENSSGGTGPSGGKEAHTDAADVVPPLAVSSMLQAVQQLRPELRPAEVTTFAKHLLVRAIGYNRPT